MIPGYTAPFVLQVPYAAGQAVMRCQIFADGSTTPFNLIGANLALLVKRNVDDPDSAALFTVNTPANGILIIPSGLMAVIQITGMNFAQMVINALFYFKLVLTTSDGGTHVPLSGYFQLVP